MTLNLGELGDALYAKHEEIAKANAALKVLTDEKRLLEERLISAMNEAGTDIARGERATCSLGEPKVVAKIDDFGALSQFVLRKKALHLFERRISSTAYREMKTSLGGKAIPGLSEFEVRSLNVRKRA